MKRNPIRKDRTTATGRAILERRVVHIHDILADSEYHWIEDHPGQEEMHRTIMAIPMYRESAMDAQKKYWADTNKLFSSRNVTLSDQHIHVNGNLAWEMGQESGTPKMKDGKDEKVDYIVTNVYEKSRRSLAYGFPPRAAEASITSITAN